MQEKKKQRKKKWKRTHCLCAFQKRVTHEIGITRHETLPSKTIRVVSIDLPRQMRRVNGNTRSRGILIQVFQLNVTMYKNAKEESRNGKRWEEVVHTLTVREGMRQV